MNVEIDVGIGIVLRFRTGVSIAIESVTPATSGGNKRKRQTEKIKSLNQLIHLGEC